MTLCSLCKVAVVLAAIGAINWLLVAVFNFDLVAAILGMSTAAKVVYILIGVAGVISLAAVLNLCPACKKPAAK